MLARLLNCLELAWVVGICIYCAIIPLGFNWVVIQMGMCLPWGLQRLWVHSPYYTQCVPRSGSLPGACNSIPREWTTTVCCLVMRCVAGYYCYCYPPCPVVSLSRWFLVFKPNWCYVYHGIGLNWKGQLTKQAYEEADRTTHLDSMSLWQPQFEQSRSLWGQASPLLLNGHRHNTTNFGSQIMPKNLQISVFT